MFLDDLFLFVIFVNISRFIHKKLWVTCGYVLITSRIYVAALDFMWIMLVYVVSE